MNNLCVTSLSTFVSPVSISQLFLHTSLFTCAQALCEQLSQKFKATNMAPHRLVMWSLHVLPSLCGFHRYSCFLQQSKLIHAMLAGDSKFTLCVL